MQYLVGRSNQHYYLATSWSTMKVKPPRKSVSFLESLSESHDEQKIEVSVPVLRKSILSVPFHQLLVLYGMFHQGLTIDPYHTMVKGLLNLILMQLVYGYFLAKASGGPGKKKLKENEDNILLLVVSATAVSALLANVVFLALILFGAPLYGLVKETYVLAYHLTFIGLHPLLICYKLDYNQFFALFQLEKLYRTVFSHPALSSGFLTVLGAWLGVIPIPLDWDRPWQLWPITILTGGYLGAFSGSLLSLLVR